MHCSHLQALPKEIPILKTSSSERQEGMSQVKLMKRSAVCTLPSISTYSQKHGYFYILMLKFHSCILNRAPQTTEPDTKIFLIRKPQLWNSLIWQGKEQSYQKHCLGAIGRKKKKSRKPSNMDMWMIATYRAEAIFGTVSTEKWNSALRTCYLSDELYFIYHFIWLCYDFKWKMTSQGSFRGVLRS